MLRNDWNVMQNIFKQQNGIRQAVQRITTRVQSKRPDFPSGDFCKQVDLITAQKNEVLKKSKGVEIEQSSVSADVSRKTDEITQRKNADLTQMQCLCDTTEKRWESRRQALKAQWLTVQ